MSVLSDANMLGLITGKSGDFKSISEISGLSFETNCGGLMYRILAGISPLATSKSQQACI
ncbi:MAG: hypothetical protein N2513_09385 [Deltaproteobacteria bacterium]|nr:hypothetical protein [Deltaproteobacteria bacterium]